MIVYGHRGNEKDYIENTIESIENCNYEGIEVDVRLTSDDILVLHHDDSYERIYSFNYKVKHTNYNTALYFCETLASLYNVIKYCKKNDKKLIIDIKESNINKIIKKTYRICFEINYDIDNIIFLCWYDIVKPYKNINYFRAIDGDSLDNNKIEYYKDILQVDGICLEYTGTKVNIETINNIKYNNLFVNVYTSKTLDEFLNDDVKVDFLTI
jgi:glycerophosphoryl diester phosphodiesterase